jgi:hypothetical protein
MDTKTFDGVFWSFVITSIIGCILGFTRQIYKSKCQSFRCWGIEIIRDTNAEEKIDELELERHQEQKSIA